MFRPTHLTIFRQTACLKKPFIPLARQSPYSSGRGIPPPPYSSRKSFAYLLAPTAAFAYFVYDEQNQPQVVSQLDKSSLNFDLWSPTKASQPTLNEKYEQHTKEGDMTRTIPPVSPGRPETLTKEEDEKLKEFWKLTLKVFGVAASSDATPIESKAKEENTVEQITDDLAAAGIGAEGADAKKKKSKMSMFKKKEQPPAPAPATASGQTANQALASVKVDDKDDKHGLAKEFNAALSSQTSEELREAFWEMVKCDNPDALLLRFLRARKWNVENALVMMVSTMQWRAAEMKVLGHRLD